MTLTEFLKGIADAIRNKKGTTEKIKATDFANEIINLPSGGAISQEEYDTAVNTATNILSGVVGYDWNGKIMQARYMFSNYDGTELDLTGLDTSKVTNMSNMFYNCSNLTKLNLGNFNTSNVTDLNTMFRSCTKLTELNLSNFNTEKVTNMNYMFNGCVNLSKINLENFNPVIVTSYSNMFSSVPTTVKIITNQTMANWLNEKFPTYTNIEIVKADWEV